MIYKPQAERRRERGQTYIEFLVVFPLLLILFLFIAVQAWWWWNQAAAAVAIHEGTSAAAREGGSIEEGYQETMRSLAIPLGGTATDYEGTFEIRYIPSQRATLGEIENERVVQIPFVGTTVFRVNASSYQRTEQFYAGPPEYFE